MEPARLGVQNAARRAGVGLEQISSGIKTRCFVNPSIFNPSNLVLLSDIEATAGLGFIVSDMISGQVGTKEDMM